MKQATLFVTAACPSSDVHIARVMSQIRKADPSTEFRFVGIGGPQMGHEGLESIGIQSTDFIFKPFFPIKNFYRKSTEIAIHPAHIYTRWVNKQVLNKLEKRYFDIVQHHHPLAFLTFENEFFMMGFHRKLREQYRFYNRICPPTFFYGLTSMNQPHLAQEYLDHFFTRVRKQQTNYEKFTFPHTQVGYEGVYQAYRFLLSQNPTYAPLVQNDRIFLPQGERFRFEEFISDLVLERRKAYRQAQGFGEQDLVIFVASGNSQREISKGLKVACEGIKRFLALEEMASFPKETLKIVISVPEFVEHQTLTRNTIAKLNWPVKYVLAEDENQKFQAMAGSDIGLAMNGQIVAECAAFQLPTLVMDPKPWQHSYITQMYNSFDSDLNLAYEGTIYPELLMQTIPNKVAYSLLEHYQDPKLRYFYAKEYSDILQQSLARLEDQVPQELASKFSSVQLRGFTSAYDMIAHTVLKAAHIYQDIHGKTNFTTSQNEKLRISALQSLGWAKGL